jgi:hypothetical protein
MLSPSRSTAPGIASRARELAAIASVLSYHRHGRLDGFACTKSRREQESNLRFPPSRRTVYH